MEIIFFLTIFVLLVYPFISLEIIRRNRSKPIMRRRILKICISTAAIVVLALALDISTTSELADWILASFIYFTFCILIWTAIYNRNSLLKGIGILCSVVVFGLALLSCTIGILGLGLILGEVIPDNRISLQDGIIVKEYHNGNAISDSRATTIAVFRTISWFPVVEWCKVKKRYEWLMLKDNVHADFDASKQILTLKGIETTPDTKRYKHWQDIIIF